MNLTLPDFIPSNMTDEELVNLLDASGAPKYLVERVTATIGAAAELEEVDHDAPDERDAANRKIEQMGATIESVRDAWKTLCERIAPEDSDTFPDDVVAVEKAIESAEAEVHP